MFFPTLKAFLEHTPENKSIKLVLDRLTLESNIQPIRALQDAFPQRFQIILWGEIREKIKQEGHVICPEIDLYLNQTTAGNPAIASDLYRLVGMPLSTPNFDNRITFTYSDVDTFLNTFHNLEPSLTARFLKALFTPPPSNKSMQKSGQKTANDVVKWPMTP